MLHVQAPHPATTKDLFLLLLYLQCAGLYDLGEDEVCLETRLECLLRARTPYVESGQLLKPIVRPLHYTVANYHSHGFCHQQDLSRMVFPIACTI
jgi:hypothetical protein